MFGLLGLMGLVVAGMAIDALLGGAETDLPDDGDAALQDQPDDMPPDTAPDAGSGDPVLDEAGGLPDGHLDPGTDEGMPQSDDRPDSPAAALTMAGSDVSDVLNGDGGDDTVYAQGGDDVASGGLGDDALWGSDGADMLDGAAGDDRLYGGADADWLRGGAGDDALGGGGGHDRLDGWEGDDALAGGRGDDRMNGGEGNDSLTGGAGNDTLVGGAGGDSLWADAGNDEIDGGAGNDTLSGGDGTDMLNGGAGDDVLAAGTAGYVTGGEGADSFHLQAGGLVTVTDYDGAEDRLLVVYDSALHPSAALTVQDDGADAVIRLDGVAIARVTEGAGLSAQDVILQPR